MSLIHAILGLLQEKPRSGYELKTQGFDRRVNHFWSADQAQIYRTLDKLDEQGWAGSELEIQQDHPNRKIYHITPQGTAELRRWQHEYQPPSTIREPFLVQFFFGADLSNAELIAMLAQQIAAQRERLAVYYCVELPALDDTAITREQVLQRLTLERGIGSAQTAIEWAERAIARIEKLPADPTS